MRSYLRILYTILFVMKFSKTHQSSLTLKGGYTSHLGLLPSGEKRKPPYSVLKPLRYKVGGPSKICARLCGLGPPGVETARVFGDWRSVATHSVFFFDFFIAQKFKKHFRYSSFANCLENKSRICTQYL